MLLIINLIKYVIFSDDHGFSPLHWACKEGHIKIVEMLIRRGARINVTNMGDDTPLHLAAAHGHRPIVQLVRIKIMFFLASHSKHKVASSIFTLCLSIHNAQKIWWKMENRVF